MDAKDVKVSVPKDPKAEPLIADGPTASSGPSPAVTAITYVLTLPLKFVGLTLLLTFELIAFLLTFQWAKALMFAFSCGTRSVPVNDEPSHRWVVSLFFCLAFCFPSLRVRVRIIMVSSSVELINAPL